MDIVSVRLVGFDCWFFHTFWHIWLFISRNQYRLIGGFTVRSVVNSYQVTTFLRELKLSSDNWFLWQRHTWSEMLTPYNSGLVCSTTVPGIHFAPSLWFLTKTDCPHNVKLTLYLLWGSYPPDAESKSRYYIFTTKEPSLYRYTACQSATETLEQTENQACPSEPCTTKVALLHSQRIPYRSTYEKLYSKYIGSLIPARQQWNSLSVLICSLSDIQNLVQRSP